MESENEVAKEKDKHSYPSIIFPLNGTAGEIESRQLCPEVKLRNPFEYEINTVNQMIEQFKWGFGIQKLNQRKIFVEVSLPKNTQWNDPVMEKRAQGDLLAPKIVALFRLFQPGPINITIMIVPLAETEQCGYHLDQLRYLPAFKRTGGYPDHYEISPSGVDELFQKYWDKDLVNTPGVFWFNRSYESQYEDERLTQIVFGLEQLLLRDESSERSYLSFKMSLRGAWLLGTSGPDRTRYFDLLRDAYKLRNEVAHGRSRIFSEQDIGFNHNIEDCVRQLILKWLNDATLFSPDKLRNIVLGNLTPP